MSKEIWLFHELEEYLTKAASGIYNGTKDRFLFDLPGAVQLDENSNPFFNAIRTQAQEKREGIFVLLGYPIAQKISLVASQYITTDLTDASWRKVEELLKSWDKYQIIAVGGIYSHIQESYDTDYSLLPKYAQSLASRGYNCPILFTQEISIDHFFQPEKKDIKMAAKYRFGLYKGLPNNLLFRVNPPIL
jgi:hypothetical protein